MGTRRDEWAVITGASRGIGAELARRFAADGWPVALVARSEEELHELSAELRDRWSADTFVATADLGEEGAATRLWSELEPELRSVGALVNNAGYGLFGRFVELSLDDQLRMLRLNVSALTELSHHAVGPMAARGHGYLMNVASTAAFQPGPLMAAYYASKAYVLWLTEAIAQELAGRVHVTALCPGPVRTGFQERAGLGDEVESAAGPMVKTAGEVADAGYRGLMRGERVVVPGIVNKVLAQTPRMTPRRLTVAIVERIQRRMGR